MFDSNEVLLDPSILVADTPAEFVEGQRTLEYFTEGESGFDVYVPASFCDVVAECDAYREDSTFELFLGNISSQRSIRDFEELRALLARDHLRAFSGREYDATRPGVAYALVRDRLTDTHPPETRGALADVLYDEFVFLFERSWIASRLKRPLAKLTDVDAGIRHLDFDDGAVEDLVDSEAVDYVTRRLRRLQAQPGWEWASVGGAASTLLDGDDEFVRTIRSVGSVHDSLVLRFDL